MAQINALPSRPQQSARHIWPGTAERHGNDLYVGGVSLRKIAVGYNTPCYVIDEVEVRRRCRDLRTAIGDGSVSFDARAMSSQRVLRWIAEEGLGLNASSAGELAVARAAGFDGRRVMLSGPKTPDDLHAALDYPVGRIVIESLSEIRRLAAQSRHARQVMLRVSLGSGTADATADGRRGLSVGLSELDRAVTALSGQPHLHLLGLDCTVDSPMIFGRGWEQTLQQLVDLLGHLNRWYGLRLTDINLGGEFIDTHPAGPHDLEAAAFAIRCTSVLRAECDRREIVVPRLTLTCGRAVVARAGIALYRLLEVWREPDERQVVVIDGGFADNPRPALCGARYTSLLLGRTPSLAERPTTVIGRYGEPGDVISRDLSLPGDLRPGDLIAVAGCGAYQHTMASNYGLVPRPPVVGVRDGMPQLLVRPETIADLLERDVA